MDKWRILGIEPTKNKNEIKEAYMNKLNIIHPEDDPEGFKKLRSAYEELLKEADREDENVEDNSPVGLWMKKVENVYKRFSLRISEDAWRELLNEDVCFGLDTKEEAGEKLLAFFMDNYRLPQNIYKLIDENFEWTSIYEDLYEQFPKDFIDFIINNIKYKELLHYDLFENIDDSKDYDGFIILYHEINSKIKDRDLENIDKKLEEIKSLEIEHPYLDLLYVRCYIIKNEMGKAREINEKLLEKYPNDNTIIYEMAEIEWVDKRYEAAKEFYSKLIELNEDDYKGRLGVADCNLELGNVDEAEEMYINILDKYPYNDYIRGKLFEVNEKFIERFKSQENNDLKEKFKISWRLLQNNRFAEIVDLMKDIEIPEEYENQYCDLMGCAYSDLEEYEKSLEYYSKWRDKLVKGLQENKYKKEEELEKESKSKADALSESDLNVDETQTNSGDKETIEVCAEDKEIAKAGSEEEGTTEAESEDKVISENAAKESNVKNEEENKELSLEEAEKQLVRAMVEIGNDLLHLKRYEDAMEVFDEAIKKDEKNINILNLKGYALNKLGRFAESVDAFDSALKIDSQHPGVLCNKGEALFNLGEYREALDLVREARDIYPYLPNAFNIEMKVFNEVDKSDLALEVFEEAEKFNVINDKLNFQKACALRKTEKLKESLELLESIFKNITDNKDEFDLYYDVCYEMSIIYSDTEKFDDALNTINKAISHDKNNVQAYYVRAYIYKVTGKLNESINDYNFIIKKNPNADFPLIKKAEIYRHKNDFERALKNYLKAIEVNPESKFVYADISRIYREKEMYDESLEYINKQLEICEDADYYFDRGYTYHNMKKYMHAIEDYEKAIELDPNCSNAYNNIGVIYNEEYDKPEKALDYYLKASELVEDTLYYKNTAQVYEKLRQFDNALVYYDKLIALESDNASFHYGKAETLYAMRKFKEAIDEYNECIKYDDNNKIIFYQDIGNCYREAKVFGKSIEYHKKALSLDKNRFGSNLKIAITYEVSKNYLFAIRYLKKEIKLNGSEPYAYFELGKIYKKLKMMKKSKECYAKSLELFASKEDNLYHFVRRGKCYIELNDYDKAMEMFDRCKCLRNCSTCHANECYEKYYYLGNLYEDCNEDEKAYEYYKKAYELAPYDDDYKEAFENIKQKIK